jgi:hypothetical protein
MQASGDRVAEVVRKGSLRAPVCCRRRCAFCLEAQARVCVPGVRFRPEPHMWRVGACSGVERPSDLPGRRFVLLELAAEVKAELLS